VKAPIYCPLMPDRLAAKEGLATIHGLTCQWRRNALLLLAELNALKRPDIYVYCGFVGDHMAVASMNRWQPDLMITPVPEFIKEASEAVEYLRRKKAAEREELA